MSVGRFLLSAGVVDGPFVSVGWWTKPKYANNGVSTFTSIWNGWETMRNHSWSSSTFFGVLYMSYHFPADVQAGTFLPAVLCTGQVHTERHCRPTDLREILGKTWENGHKFKQSSTCPCFFELSFLYAIHRHGVLIREITTWIRLIRYMLSAGM